MTTKRRAGSAEQDTTQLEQHDTSEALSELSDKFKAQGTAIEVDFRSLVDWIRLGDQLTHHLHPYPAKLLPNIAHFFVNARSLLAKKPAVLDPFCGSGTVALEASMAGCSAMIADANPLAVLIAKVKTTPYDVERLQETLRALCSRLRRVRTAPSVPIVNEHIWYTSKQKLALERVSRVVHELEDESTRDFFRVCFSALARKLSFADPAISVPVRMRLKETIDGHHSTRIAAQLTWLKSADTFAEFEKICEANIARVRNANVARPDRRAALFAGNDARQLKSVYTEQPRKLRAGSVPLIITSPPYGSAQKYVRASSLSLNWLGLAGPDELAALEGASIGREHAPKYRHREIPDTLPKDYRDLCRRIEKENPIRGRITLEYLYDMRLALQEMARVTTNGGKIVIVIGNNQVCGQPLRNDRFVCEILQNEGLSIALNLVDHIKSRGLMTKRNKTASVISRESVLVFSKNS